MAQQALVSDKKRLTWLVIAAVVMFACAYSVTRWLGVVGKISGWIGSQQHKAEIPRLSFQAEIWEMLVLMLPFLAAILIWTGRQKAVSREDIAGFLLECCICLAVSIFGTLAFLLCLFGLGMLINKLG
jgi:hypothetical protein